MAQPVGIYEPHSSSALNAEKLGNHPATGMSISIDQLLTAFKGENEKYIEKRNTEIHAEQVNAPLGLTPEENSIHASSADQHTTNQLANTTPDPDRFADTGYIAGSHNTKKP